MQEKVVLSVYSYLNMILAVKIRRKPQTTKHFRVFPPKIINNELLKLHHVEQMRNIPLYAVRAFTQLSLTMDDLFE